MADSAPTFRSASELPALVSYVRERRCVLFVGAGLSRPAGYPGWGDLMKTVVDGTAAQLGDVADRAALDALLAQGKFAEVADQCRTLLGRTFFGQLLRSVLARDAAPPEATHRAIVETPYACLVTTNFDTLLEDAFARWSDFGIPKAPTGMELSQHGTLLLDGAFFILKAHGTIHDDDSMVFTSEDYRRITHANPAFQAVMSSLLLTHAVLFVGYSLSDPNFRLLIDSQLSTFGSDAPPRYALMENVGAAEKAILRRTTGIEVISFAQGAYGEVAGLLQYLAQASRAPVTPAATAPAWAANGATPRPRKEERVPAAAARRVLRPTTGDPAFVLRLRARDVMVDGSWYLTTTRDLDGVSLPLHAIKATTSITPSWAELQRLIPVVVDRPWEDGAMDAMREAGDVLAAVTQGIEEDLLAAPPGTTVILDVGPELSALPWEWMPVGEWSLGLGWPTCRRMPGLSDASRGRPLVRDPLRALLIGDTLADSEWRHRLPAARTEVEELAALLSSASSGADVTLLLGQEASYERVLHELRDGRYDVVHFAGVSHFDESGSYLMLHDGKVGAAELVTLLIKRPPALLFANALYAGFVPVFCGAFPLPLREGMSFDDHYRAITRHRVGFERAASRAGVGTFVGSMGLTSDEMASRVARSFYERLLKGRNAAQALHQARRRTFDDANAAGKPLQDTTLMQLAMAGYADLRLVGAARGRQAGAAKVVATRGRGTPARADAGPPPRGKGKRGPSR
jgi:SIR2-like domain/CHAT domain